MSKRYEVPAYELLAFTHGGEIKRRVHQEGTQHEQSTNKGTGKMIVLREQGDQNRPEQVAGTVQHRRRRKSSSNDFKCQMTKWLMSEFLKP